MKFQLYVIFVILKFVLYLTTKVGGDDESRKILYDWVVIRPAVSEIITAIKFSDSNLSGNVQDTNLQFFTIGRYSDDCIGQLNTFYTLSKESIRLNPDELTTLTSDLEYYEPQYSRILTQVKFYRKVQELQCANYVILNIILQDVEIALNDIAYFVYSMIEMSYNMSFPVGAWLWELYIKLMGLQDATLKSSKFLKEHLMAITETLVKLINSCQENNYLETKADLSRFSDVGNRQKLLGKYLCIYDAKYSPFFRNHTFVTLHVDSLMLKPLWSSSTSLFCDIPGLVFDWYTMYGVLAKEIANIKKQCEKNEWTIEPFRYIKCHEIVLDIIKARLYGFLWVHLTFYQKTVGSKNHQEELITRLNDSMAFDFIGYRSFDKDHHEEFIRILSKALSFIYTDDPTFNDVLVLLSEINEPNDKQINVTIEILSSEVNNIISKYTGQNQAAGIDYKHVERCFENDYSKFLVDYRQQFIKFKEDTEKTLQGFKLIFLSFYINGSKTTNFVFPNESQ